MTPDDDDSLTGLIRTLENERYAAMIAGDAGALDRLLSDRLVYGHSNAARDSKDSFLERVRDRTFVYESIDHPEERIIIAGGAAVVLGAMIAGCTTHSWGSHILAGYDGSLVVTVTTR